MKGAYGTSYTPTLAVSRTVSEMWRRILAQNHKIFVYPFHLAPAMGVAPFEFLEDLYGS